MLAFPCSSPFAEHTSPGSSTFLNHHMTISALSPLSTLPLATSRPFRESHQCSGLPPKISSGKAEKRRKGETGVEKWGGRGGGGGGGRERRENLLPLSLSLSLPP
eukprot:Sspe_Gene.107783::Locus_86260_Transcript_1_1_Confidence_1.000_Length_498::g.107783::m.107783